jgi:hypothetical protein
MINYEAITTFEREFKRLLKKYPSLEGDFTTLRKTVVELVHTKHVSLPYVVRIEGLCANDGQYMAMKVRKFSCRSLKGKGSNTGLRLIYVFEPSKKKVTFLEIYCKADKANEDRERIKEFIKKLK